MMTKMMKAAQIDHFGQQQLEIVDVPIPTIRHHNVLFASAANAAEAFFNLMGKKL